MKIQPSFRFSLPQLPSFFQTSPSTHSVETSSSVSSISSIPVRKSSGINICGCVQRFCYLIKKLYLRVWYFFKGLCVREPKYLIPAVKVDTRFNEAEIAKMRDNWNAMGANKWKLAIDGKHHSKGKWVFDKGLHGGTVEPGYVVSMENNALPLISKYLGTRTNCDLILKLHEAACWHFKGTVNSTLMGKEGIGKFRGKDSNVSCTYTLTESSSQKGMEEFLTFKPKLGNVEWVDNSKKKCKISYLVKAEHEIRSHMKTFLGDFYREIVRAKTREKKILAIAWLAKKMDFLHLVRDCSTRTSLLTMQKHLTEYLGHPGIFDNPNMMTELPIKDLVKYIDNALEKYTKLISPG